MLSSGSIWKTGTPTDPFTNRMRVVSGEAKGVTLQSVPGTGTRPILDRVKTALFDIIRPTLPEAVFLDLFAGSGSVGIEALSQGAKRAVFLDLSKAAVDTIKSNLQKTALSERAEVRHADAFGYLRNTKGVFDIIFIAPPQYKNLWQESMWLLAERPGLVSTNGSIIVQIDPSEYEKLELSAFEENKARRYGNTLLIFYAPVKGQEEKRSKNSIS